MEIMMIRLSIFEDQFFCFWRFTNTIFKKKNKTKQNGTKGKSEQK